jgi:NAD dependent epimerase/dehydratase
MAKSKPSTLRRRQVLVTGAGGFIGSHLVDRLVDEGASVRAFLRYTSRSDIGCLGLSPIEVRSSVELVFGDLRDEDAVSEAMRGVEVVFHLGALIAIPYSYLHPREVAETNVMGTLNVLMAARRHQPARLLHTSTSEVYGTARRVPIDEDHPLQGQSPYSASKIGADKLVESFVRSFELPAVTVRPFNTYGPRQSARAVIPTIISQALWRSEIELGDVTPTRDFTYVTDVVDGFVRAAQADGVVGETLNLGSDHEISIGDLASLIIQLVGRDVQVRTDPERLRPPASEVRRLRADTRRAAATLGWRPQTSLEAGLTRTIEWMREHPNLFEPERYGI